MVPYKEPFLQEAALDARWSYKEPADYLCKPASNDVEKVRAFFMFIASQDRQKIGELMKNRRDLADSPLSDIHLEYEEDEINLNEVLHRLCK